MNTNIGGPLKGIRVLDFTRAFSGPLCTMMLAEFGADVIKVENPKNPDETRTWPPFVGGEMSSYFSALNRNKRSAAIDLKTDGGRDAIFRMFSWADVVVENFTPGVAERLGIDHVTARSVNESLVYCSISGFGQDGPYRDRKGYDPVLQAMGGLMGVTGERDRGAVKSMIPIADYQAGSSAAIAILASIIRSKSTGKGEYIDIGMLDAMVALTSTVGTAFLHDGKVPERSGTENPTRVPSSAFNCADGTLIQLVPNQQQWKRFCEVLDLPQLVDDVRFATNLDRIAHQAELYPILRERFLERSSDEWLEVLTASGIPAGPIYTLDKLFVDPQVIHRDMVASLDHPTAGPMKAIKLPYRMQEAPTSISKHPPAIGEHTVEALVTAAGYSRQEALQIISSGIAAQTSTMR